MILMINLNHSRISVGVSGKADIKDFRLLLLLYYGLFLSCVFVFILWKYYILWLLNHTKLYIVILILPIGAFVAKSNDILK